MKARHSPVGGRSPQIDPDLHLAYLLLATKSEGGPGLALGSVPLGGIALLSNDGVSEMAQAQAPLQDLVELQKRKRRACWEETGRAAQA